MKFCYNTDFTLPKQSQRSRSVLQDGSRSLELFWKEKTPSYNQRNTVSTIETMKTSVDAQIGPSLLFKYHYYPNCYMQGSYKVQTVTLL